MIGRELLGTVKLETSELVLIDMGLLHLWSHVDPPLMAEHDAPPHIVEMANAADDCRIVGPDAERAGVEFGRQEDPRYLFDVAPALREAFEAFVSERGLDARLEALPERVPHRRRVDLALERDGASGSVPYHGPRALCFGGLPTGRELEVLGTRMPAGEHERRWRFVDLEVAGGGTAVRTEPCGEVAVDTARLAFADADALGAWEHHGTLDGRADFLFWGRDADALAREVGAEYLGDGQHGWRDTDVDRVVELGTRVEELQRERELVLATDFRPHSHHWQVLEQARVSPTESGCADLGAARLCGFFTTWGDGFFPVWRELDADGGLLRIRIELGGEESVERLRALNED